jgi:hypothetical protein
MTAKAVRTPPRTTGRSWPASSRRSRRPSPELDVSQLGDLSCLAIDTRICSDRKGWCDNLASNTGYIGPKRLSSCGIRRTRSAGHSSRPDSPGRRTPTAMPSLTTSGASSRGSTSSGRGLGSMTICTWRGRRPHPVGVLYLPLQIRRVLDPSSSGRRVRRRRPVLGHCAALVVRINSGTPHPVAARGTTTGRTSEDSAARKRPRRPLGALSRRRVVGARPALPAALAAPHPGRRPAHNLAELGRRSLLPRSRYGVAVPL